MGVGKISIQRQRTFTFRDALHGALGPYLDKSQVQVPERMVWDRGQCFGQLRFGSREGRHGIVHKDKCPQSCLRAPIVRARRVVGVGGYARSKKLRACVRLSVVTPLLNQAIP